MSVLGVNGRGMGGRLRLSIESFAFQRQFKEIEPIFKVIGFLEGVEETYTPLKMYDSFQISLKSEL